MAHCFRSTAPFEWREAPYDPLANPKAKEVMDRASDFRMRDGFCVPVHTSDGDEAVITMAGERVEFAGRVKPALHLTALYAYGKAVDLCTPKRLPAAPGVLTRRWPDNRVRPEVTGPAVNLFRPSTSLVLRSHWNAAARL